MNAASMETSRAAVSATSILTAMIRKGLVTDLVQGAGRLAPMCASLASMGSAADMATAILTRMIDAGGVSDMDEAIVGLDAIGATLTQMQVAPPVADAVQAEIDHAPVAGVQEAAPQEAATTRARRSRRRRAAGAQAALDGPRTLRKASETGQKPFLDIRKSVMPDAIVCLEDGKAMKMLKRHLRAAYGMTADEYRWKWDLPDNYPLVAPNYARQKSNYARSVGLGTHGMRAGSRQKVAA